MDTISILVVEDETEFLRTYCEAITREPDFRLLGAVSTLAAGMAVIGQSVPDVLPEWAFFVRAVLDTERLGLTASREALHDDELLDETRARLGDQLKRWLLRMARTDPQRAEDFFRVHHLAVKSAATSDDEMLDVVAEILPWETTT